MKVLWVCNVVPLPAIAQELRLDTPVVGGWMTGLADELVQRPDIELSVCFPLVGVDGVVRGRAGEVDFYAFPARRRVPFLDLVDERDTSGPLRAGLARIVADAGPDLLHVFGTEFGHALAAVEAFGLPERTLVTIQGLTSIAAGHYLGSLPPRVRHRPAVSNLVRGSLARQSTMLAERGKVEVATLRAAGHVSGRTDWDRACTLQINPDATYHHCPEALRASFYEGEWRRDGVEPHSILMTQGSNPVKGLYYLLDALPELLRRFPRAHLYVAGTDPTAARGSYEWLKRSAYGSYLAGLIRDRGLEASVSFLGPLTAPQMRERLLRSHVFVSASTIENSSNGLCEAQLLGVPCVASFVGGIPSLLDHGVDGFAYQHDAPYMLAHYVGELFDRDDLAESFSRRGRLRAQRRHDRAAVATEQVAIYESMLGVSGR
ncbi:MAG: glycosyltransferase [Propionibacterium sp.]|nr:glycosyltransferase [Propionibacterium sp.]